MSDNNDLLALATQVNTAALAWQRAGIEKRLAVLQEAGAQLASSRNRLQEILRAEGLSVDLARDYAEWVVHAGDPQLLSNYARNMVQLINTGSGSGELLVRKPDGVVLLFAQAGSPTFNAAPLFSILLAGNGALVVRAPFVDAGVRFIAEQILQPALQRHNFAKEVVLVVTERYREALADFITAPEVKTVISIGSAMDNSNVARQCQEQGKKAVLEHYGRGCMVVWSDASIDQAVDSARRAFDFSSRPCFIPKQFLVHAAAFDQFVNRLVEIMPRYSNTVEADPEHGVLAPAAMLAGYQTMLEEACQFGQLRYGGYRMDAQGHHSDTGNYVPPTLVSVEAKDCFSRSLQCVDQEIFFPLAPIVRFSGPDEQILREMTEIIQRNPVGLRTSIWTKTPEIMAYFTREINSVSLLRFNTDHSQTPNYASFWGGGNGDNHLFWEKTSHLQAIDCQSLNQTEVLNLLKALGAVQARDFSTSAAASVTAVPTSVPAKLAATPTATTTTITTTTSQPTTSAPANTTWEELNYQVENGVARLEMNRPKRHNSISTALRDALYQATEQLMQAGPELRCVVITGAGRSFCSGADLKDLTSFNAEEARQYMLKATWAFRRFEQLSVPVIAAVKGYCMGGGFEMALHCDEIIAADDTTFCFPETGIGIVTTTGAVGRLISTVGTMQARLLLTGRKFSAAEALQIGLVSQVVPSAELENAITNRCQELLKQPPEGLAAIKNIMRKFQGDIGTTSWIAEIEAFDSLVQGPWQRFVNEQLKKG